MEGKSIKLKFTTRIEGLFGGCLGLIFVANFSDYFGATLELIFGLKRDWFCN